MADAPSRFAALVVQAGDAPLEPRASVAVTGQVKAMGLTHQLIGESIRDETLWMMLAATGPVDPDERYEVRVRRREATTLFKEIFVGDTVTVTGHRSVLGGSDDDDVIQASHVEVVATNQPLQLERLKAAAASEAEAAAAAGAAMVEMIERFAEAGGDPHEVQEAVAQAVGSRPGISDFLSSEAEMIAGHLVDDAG